MHIYEELFSKSQSSHLELTFEPHIYLMALSAFWKRALHIWTNIVQDCISCHVGALFTCALFRLSNLMSGPQVFGT